MRVGANGWDWVGGIIRQQDCRPRVPGLPPAGPLQEHAHYGPGAAPWTPSWTQELLCSPVQEL